VGLEPDRVDDGVGAATTGQLAHGLADVVGLIEVEHLDTSRPRALEPLRHQVDPDHTSGALLHRDAAAHVADRAQAEHRDAAALGHVGVLDRLPRGWQHVRQVDEALVRRAVGHLDGAVLGLRDP
jgi:hypothetical protein